MERNNFFTKCQHGFRKGYSCVTQLLEVMEDWVEALDRGEDIDVIFLTSHVPSTKFSHKLLILKLQGYGIVGHVLNWVKDFLKTENKE